MSEETLQEIINELVPKIKEVDGEEVVTLNQVESAIKDVCGLWPY